MVALSAPSLAGGRAHGIDTADRVVRCQSHPPHASADACSSRRLALASLAAVAPALLLSPAGTARAAEEEAMNAGFPSASPEADTTITDRVYLDFGLCPEAIRVNRTLGDKSALCLEPEPLGRLVIGLYGKAAPGTVALFLATLKAGAYEGSALTKILPGQFLSAGKQGSHRMGLVEAPAGLPPNPDILSASAFRLRHLRPGTVSLNLSENEDESDSRFAPGYRNTSFRITTGPAPAPYLDDENIVFGIVLEGLDVVRAIEAVPTFSPSGNSRAYNDFARVLGDERANTTRAKWGRPLKAVVITAAGVAPPGR